MHRIPLAVLVLLLPAAALAASRSAEAPALTRVGRSVVVATSSPWNAYAGGASVVFAAPVAGDLSALGGTIVDAAPVGNDALLIGGTVTTRAPVEGDVRILAGTADVEKPVGGDLAVVAFSVSDTAHVKGTLLIVGGSVTLSGGGDGPVTVYGNSVTLGGDFAGDVRIVAGDRLTLLPGTNIRGALVYQAPMPAAIPDSASVGGGVTYTEASYLPGAGISRTLAFASIGIFLLARVLAALFLAGLLAGLFPQFARTLVDAAYGSRMRKILLSMLLGFAAFVAVPILALLLSLTFVGLGLAMLLFILYALLLLLSLVYAGILVGGLFARRFLGRREIRWSDGVLGTLALSLAALIPVAGLLLVLFLASFAAGVLLLSFFKFAFVRDEDDMSL